MPTSYHGPEKKALQKKLQNSNSQDLGRPGDAKGTALVDTFWWLMWLMGWLIVVYLRSMREVFVNLPLPPFFPSKLQW